MSPISPDGMAADYELPHDTSSLLVDLDRMFPPVTFNRQDLTTEDGRLHLSYLKGQRDVFETLDKLAKRRK